MQDENQLKNEIFDMWPPTFPDSLRDRASAAVLQAITEFPERTRIQGLCRTIVAKLIPLACEAVGKRKKSPREMLVGIWDVLRSLLIRNIRESERDVILREIARSAEWKLLMDKLGETEVRTHFFRTASDRADAERKEKERQKTERDKAPISGPEEQMSNTMLDIWVRTAQKWRFEIEGKVSSDPNVSWVVKDRGQVNYEPDGYDLCFYFLDVLIICECMTRIREKRETGASDELDWDSIYAARHAILDHIEWIREALKCAGPLLRISEDSYFRAMPEFLFANQISLSASKEAPPAASEPTVAPEDKASNTGLARARIVLKVKRELDQIRPDVFSKRDVLKVLATIPESIVLKVCKKNQILLEAVGLIQTRPQYVGLAIDIAAVIIGKAPATVKDAWQNYKKLIK